MKTIAMVCVLSLAGAGGAALAVQDPERSQDPEGEAAKGTPKRDPLEGLYRLRGRTVGGVPDLDRATGYVAITPRHMLICLAGAGPDPDYPLLRAGVRTWSKRKEGVETVLKLGFYTDDDGDIHVEEPGTMEVRRIDRIRGMLRIWQGDQSFLDFERVE